MEFKELTIQEFTNFVDNHPLKNFFQTKYMYNRYIDEKKKVFLVGVKKDNKVVGASLLVNTSTFRGYDMYEALQGLILDYNDTELLNFFIKELKSFLSTKNVYKLVINPYLPVYKYTSDGNITKEIDNSLIRNKLRNLGFKRLKKYDQVSWIYCLDIENKTEEELFKSIRSSARTKINKTINKYELNVRKLSFDELEEFKKITSDTCNRKHFQDRSLSYYQNMCKAFKEQVGFYICEIDIGKYRKKLISEIDELEEKINNKNVVLSEKKRREVEEELGNLNKGLKDLDSISKEDKVIPLSAAMFIFYGDEVVYMFGGSYDEYLNFLGQYRIQWELICYAAKHKYKRYNFYGIKDLNLKGAKEDGVLKFKQNFNGYILELIGPYSLAINKMIYSLEKVYTRIRGK